MDRHLLERSPLHMSPPALPPDAPGFARRFPNLADPRLGAAALIASDEFFAAKERMLDPVAPVFIPGKYDDNGKWMDGWETRRKRGPGHDWCIVKLARPGTIEGVDFDTSHFTGNFPPAASLEACDATDGEPGPDTVWSQVIPPTTLAGNSHHFIAADGGTAFTHVRVNLFPDGGLARLRIYGRPRPDWDLSNNTGLHNLAAIENGARVVAANNEHFGSASTILMPGRGVDMGDGWETRRRREPGNDWCVIELAAPGTIVTAEVDTRHFKGNFPDRCSIQAASVPSGTDASLVTQSMFWPVLLPEQALSADHLHSFTGLESLGKITHVRFNIIPDGGVSRLRLLGTLG